MKSGRIAIILLVLLISLTVNFFFLFSSQNKTQNQSLDNSQTAYPLLSTKLQQSDYTNNLINDFLPLRQKLHTITDSYNNSVAVYFKYLPTGTSIGINENADFTAESLLKVPVVMAYFHKKERLGIKTDLTVTIHPNELNTEFGDLYKRGAGASINLSDVVKLALQKSDNTASLILADQISNDDFMYVYQGLDIDPTVAGKSPLITAHQYASILRALFRSSILTKEDSEYILSLLTKTDFHDLLPNGVPNNIPVAHKIGLVDNQIYSDCGIVYVPHRPYVLCIISKSDSSTAKIRMHDVSETTYNYVSGYKTN